jgi:rRNA-processing protein FCF1
MIPNFIDELILRYVKSGILIDTNLLLLFLMGAVDAKQIDKFKRTKQFTIEDFWLIEKLLDFFEIKVTTPNILTEVSNLAGQLSEPLKSRFLERLGEQVKILTEKYCPSVEACAHPYFNKCGLTDSAILSIAESELLVLTDDFQLAGLISGLGIDVINFNHLRQSHLWEA